MPLYEYECGTCGHRFERIQRFADPPVEDCPACSARTVHKLLSAPAIQFKGTGWYVTDYGGKKDSSAPASTTPAPSASGSESAASPSSSSDAKTTPAPKTDK
jgi:putative FmdB family regulatory protein